MCECGKSTNGTAQPSASQGVTDAVANLFKIGAVGAAKLVRKNICCSSSPCGCWCARLVKAPGVAPVYCVDPVTGEKIDLHRALAAPTFRCPDGRF
jgi:hypothetical protein